MKVAVVGAGLGGLTFAGAMKKHSPGVEVAVYERDASATSRAQGYAIGLRNGFGPKALDDVGLRDRVIGQNAVKVTDFAIVRNDFTRPVRGIRPSETSDSPDFAGLAPLQSPDSPDYPAFRVPNPMIALFSKRA